MENIDSNRSYMYIPYQVVAASSQSMDSRVEELSNRSLRVYEPLQPVKSGGWENDRYCTWPQEVVIKLDVRAQVSHVLIVSKEDRSIPEC